MFECLVGWPPFCAEDRRDVYRKIVNWQHCLYFPDDVRVGHYAEHLIRRYVFCTHEHKYSIQSMTVPHFSSLPKRRSKKNNNRLPAFAHSHLTDYIASSATATTASAVAGPTSSKATPSSRASTSITSAASAPPSNRACRPKSTPPTSPPRTWSSRQPTRWRLTAGLKPPQRPSSRRRQR